MENQSLLRKLFLPCVGLLFSLEASIMLLRGIADHIMATHFHEKITSPAIQLGLPLGSFLVLPIAIYLCRKVDLKKVFNLGLILMGLLIISSLYLFDPHISYFLVSKVCPAILLFLGWAYINHIATPADGLKYYFPLYFLAFLFAMAVQFIHLTQISPESPSYPTVLFVMIILCLVLAYIFGRIIRKKSSETVKTDDQITTRTNNWIPVVSVALFIAGIKWMNLLNFNAFKTFLKATTSNTEYLSYMGKHFLFSGVGTWVFSILSVLIGPWILKKKGWKFCILTLIALATVTLVLLSINPTRISIHSLHHIILTSLSYTCMIPLGQIAVLNYSLKDRFMTQAYALIVAVPLFEWGIRLCKGSFASSLFMSFTILGLMATAVMLMTKNNKSLPMRAT